MTATPDLLDAVRRDALRQLFVARRSARNWARAQQAAELGPVERAEANWREMNPGLAAVIDQWSTARAEAEGGRPRPGPHLHPGAPMADRRADR